MRRARDTLSVLRTDFQKVRNSLSELRTDFI
jgi:hypothetical protein